MVAVHTTQVRLLSARSLPGGVTLEPIRLDSTRSAMRCVDARVRFYPTFGPDGLFSRDTPGDPMFELKTWFGSHLVAQVIGSNSGTAGLAGGELEGPRFGPTPLAILRITMLNAISRARSLIETGHQVSVDHHTGRIFQ